MRRQKTAVWGAAATDPLKLTKERVRELRQLCHPDKHSGSPLSQRMTLWLNEVSKVLDSQSV
jgi:hypothetical protein